MVTKSYSSANTVKTTTKLTQQNGQDSGPDSVSYSTVKWTNSVTYGENVAGWRERLRQGLDATTTLSGSESTSKLIAGRLYVDRPYIAAFPTQIRSVLVTGSLNIDISLPAGNPSSLSSTSADAKALARFGQRITELTSAMQGGIVLGELAQTLRMIKNPTQALRRNVDNWTQVARNIRGPRRALPNALLRKRIVQDLGDAWLEVQFGWRPLLNDIRDGAQALHRHKIGQAGIETRSVRASATTESAVLSSEGQQASLAVWKNGIVSTERVSVYYRGAMRVEARNPSEMDPELFGFNPGAFLPTLWELTPYSFLIDYFTNVGEVIEGFSHLVNRLSWCNRTERKELEKSVESWTNKALVKKTVPDIASVTLMPAKYVCSKKSVSRARYTGTLVPGLTFEIPGIGSLKWLNIAALVANRRGDRSWFYD